MLHTAVITALAVAGLAMGQDITIKVGEVAGTFALKFDPANVTITQPNSVVTFVFDGAPGNHTVAQSSFAAPCEPLEGGFNSGFVFHGAATDPVASWNLTVTNVSAPIWFFCAQQMPSPHCTSGMVGSINAPVTGNTFDMFLAKAQAAGSAGVPTTTATSGLGAFATALPVAISTTTAVSVTGSGTATGASPSASATSPASGTIIYSSGSGTGSGTGTGTDTSSSATSSTTTNSASNVGPSGLFAIFLAALGIVLV